MQLLCGSSLCLRSDVQRPAFLINTTQPDKNFAGLKMGLKDFKIQFDNPYATYAPDQNVTGKIILTIDSPKSLNGVYYILN